MSTGKILLGIAAGIAAGALLGILLAPDKGKNTRRKIGKKGEDYVDAVKDKISDFMDTITEKFQAVKEEVEDITSQTSNPVTGAEKEAKTT